MSFAATLIAQREKGQYPLSIATSLALEGAMGIHEDHPVDGPPPILSYESIWINIRTLFRNIHGSMPNDSNAQLLQNDYADAMFEEVQVIKGILEQNANRIQVFFYFCTYDSLSKKYPYGRFKEATTPKQVAFATLEKNTLTQFIAKCRIMGIEVKAFDLYIQGNGTKTLLLTHYPIDMLHMVRANQLTLLESHTGKMKRLHRCNSKLLNGKDLIRIPFDRMTIQLFGDSGHLFAPYPISTRRRVLEIAEKYQWNANTTQHRMLQCLQAEYEPLIETVVKRLYNS